MAYGPEFHVTPMGAKFFNAQIPDAIGKLGRCADGLARCADGLERCASALELLALARATAAFDADGRSSSFEVNLATALREKTKSFVSDVEEEG